MADAGDGDVVAVMCHAERAEVAAWLAGQGGTGTTRPPSAARWSPARGEHEAEDAIAALWDLARTPAARVAQAAELMRGGPGGTPG